MKLRIKGNTLRLRLTQTELDQLGRGETVREEIPFPQATLTYAVRPDATLSSMAVQYQGHEVLVRLPEYQVREWVDTDLVGLEETLEVGNGKTLYLLLEKDFQCLHKRPNEEESDQFANPAAIRE
ncbi:hypothetical protein BH24BAC1_BH24BAC1_31440 [soil metagenome]